MPLLLYSTRSLSLLWLPAGFHSPCLHHHDGALRWFWRCDLTFLSWLMARTAELRAKSTPLSEDDRRTCDLILSYVCSTHNITDADRSRLPAPGATLPDELLAESISLFDMHCGPSWPGMAKLAERLKLPLLSLDEATEQMKEKHEYIEPTRLRRLAE